METEMTDLILKKILDLSGYRNFNFQHLMLFTSISIGALLTEVLILGYEHSSVNRILAMRDHSSKTDLISYLMGLTGLIKVAAAICTFGLLYRFTNWVESQTGVDLILKVTPGLSRDIIAFIVIDFFAYWRHWFLHKIPILWNFHKFHHSARFLNMITFHRIHVLHAAYIGFFEGLLFLLIGYHSIMSYIWIVGIRYLHGLIVHSQLNWGWGFIGRFVIVSPRFHQIHHSEQASHMNKNMGTSLIFWDILFNTYCDPREETKELGLPQDTSYRKSYFSAQLDWYRQLIHFFRY